MKWILDSCAFIDIAINAPTLTPQTRQAFEDSDNYLFLSVASVWELGLKRSLGKLDFDIKGAVQLLAGNGINTLDIDLPTTLLVNELPYHHKDPFDRIIIASAKVHDMGVITSDRFFGEYGIKTLCSRL